MLVQQVTWNARNHAQCSSLSLPHPPPPTPYPTQVDQLKLSTQGKDSHPFWIERAIWFVLYEAARFSIECNSAVIMFPGEKHGPLDAGTIAAEAKENTEGAIPQEGK